MKKTVIVMPVANEEATMGRVIEEILALPYDNLLQGIKRSDILLFGRI